MCVVLFYFFFFKQKTAYDLRISDWSSDVCSSDLVSARYEAGRDVFVIEADEYDTAFFDKRSKFVHYRPRTAILNNLEYDHADIFPDLTAIETQFHHLLRTIPAQGLIVRPTACDALDRVLERGCWTPIQTFGPGGQWQAGSDDEHASHFTVRHDGQVAGTEIGRAHV